jgi:hypothetical protein
MKKPAGKTRPQQKIGDEALQEKTGRNWAQWFAVLDKAGALKMEHRARAEFLHEKHGVSEWWSQMVAVEFEKARGLRRTNQRMDGSYEVSVSRTLPLPLEAAFAAWSDDKARRKFLDAPVSLRKATPCKSMRFNWERDGNIFELRFYPKGGAKTQVVVQHFKLRNAAELERMRKFWARTLEGSG